VVLRRKIKVRHPKTLMNVSLVIYTAADESFVTCLDAKTGENVWTESVGGKYAASPVYADGRVYIF
jgi:outer membrane protein assembly factor BamB